MNLMHKFNMVICNHSSACILGVQPLVYSLHHVHFPMLSSSLLTLLLWSNIFLLAFCKLIWLHSTYFKSQCSSVILFFRLSFTQSPTSTSLPPPSHSEPHPVRVLSKLLSLPRFLFCYYESLESILHLDKSGMKIMIIMTLKYYKSIHPFSSLPHSCCWIIPQLN